MRTLIAFLLCCSLCPTVTADVVFNSTTGQTLYVRFDDSSNTAANLTEGSTLKVGRYVAADSVIVTAGLAAGTYSARIFQGTAAGQANTDVQVGVIDEFTWSGTVELTPARQAVSLQTQAKADVNAEVVDALNVDTYAEPGQATPAATLSLASKINYLYKAWRNRKTQTATQYSLYNDEATTVGQKATTSDDGTTTGVTEITTGP